MSLSAEQRRSLEDQGYCIVKGVLAQPLARHPAECVITGQPGDVLILDGRLWHSGRRNDSTGPRRAGQMVIAGSRDGDLS